MNYVDNSGNLTVSTVPADGLASSGPRTSAGTTMTNFGSPIYTGDGGGGWGWGVGGGGWGWGVGGGDDDVDYTAGV